MPFTTFDLDDLRSYATGVELGSFAKAADRLHRSTSAISMHLKKLEEQVGAPILRKSGRRLVPTPAGEVLLSYARRLLELNDDAVAALKGAGVQEHVRLGLQEDFGEGLLSDVLNRFTRLHPGVRVELTLARNARLIQGVQSGALDLVLAWQQPDVAVDSTTVGSLPLCWVGPVRGAPRIAGDEVVPLVALEAPCLMRSAATDALDAAGVRWRVVATSPSLAGVWAIVKAGLGYTVRTRAGLPAGLRTTSRLPPLPSIHLQFFRGVSPAHGPASELERVILQSVNEHLRRWRRPGA